MNKEIAKRICEQMTEDIDSLCNCPRKDEKIIDCYGCRELAIKTLLGYINQLEKENKQLKDNWNKLKEWAKYERKIAVGMQNGYGTSLCDCMMNKMQELEGDSNVNL